MIHLSVDLIPEVEKIIYNDPATIVFFKDGTKSVAKAAEGDIYDKEVGAAMAIMRRLYGREAFKDMVKSGKVVNKRYINKDKDIKVGDIVMVTDTNCTYDTFYDFVYVNAPVERALFVPYEIPLKNKRYKVVYKDMERTLIKDRYSIFVVHEDGLEVVG